MENNKNNENNEIDVTNKTIGVDTSDISCSPTNRKITYRIESPRNITTAIQPYEKGNYKNQKLELAHNICIILNYLIISASLVLISLFIYDLINKINTFGIDKTIDIFSNISGSFNKVTLFLDTFERIIEPLDGIDKGKVQHLLNEINYTLYNINSKLERIESEYEIQVFDNNNNNNGEQIIPQNPNTIKIP